MSTMKKNSGNTPENKIPAMEIEENLIHKILVNSAEMGRPDIVIGPYFNTVILVRSISQVMAEELEKFKK